MIFQKKQKHPLADIFGDEWAENAMRRIRLQEIAEQVQEYTRKIALAKPPTTEERIFAKGYTHS